MNMKNIFMAVVLAALCTNGVFAFVQTNFFRPYDQALRLERPKKKKFCFGATVEVGSKTTGRNWDDVRRNVLALHDDKQSALAMIKNSQDATIKQKNQLISALMGIPSLDDDGGAGYMGNPGYFDFSGNFRQWNVNLFGSYKLPMNNIPGNLVAQVYVPVLYKEVHNTKLVDQTKVDTGNPHIDSVNERIKSEFTTNLKDNVLQWNSLSLSDWDKTGLGDLVFMLRWHDRYRQDKEYLKIVGLYSKLGISIPTGEEIDEDKAFSMAMGLDGAWAIPFGFGLELDFVHKIRAGLDVDFLAILDKERVRRLKTSIDQTEFLLLNKGTATKEYGLTWQFHLYVQALEFFKGFSARVAYQFVKHDDDRLVPKRNDFDYSVINSANSLKEWNSHNFVFSLTYDAFKDFKEWKVAPQIQLFFKLPVAGRNIIDNQSFGGQLTFNF